MPRVITIDPEHPDAAALEEAAVVLRRGGLVGIPTETVYGLAGRALDPAVLGRIFAAKGRPTSHPLIAHVEGEAQARVLAANWPDVAARLAERFFPGPLTLIVPRAAHVPLELTGGAETVAVRAPMHAVARALLRAVGEPLAAPSANRYQSVSPTTAAHVVESLGDRVDLVLDAGPCVHGIESSVVDVTVDPPRLLRPGALSVAEVRSVVPELLVQEGLVAKSGAERASPGLDARHYAPRAHVHVAPSQAAAFATVSAAVAAGKRVTLVLHPPIRHPILAGDHLRVIVLPESASGYAAQLFATLHAADAAGSQLIVVEDVPTGEAWLAVRDRLRRARA